MKIALTGSTGLVGSRFFDLLKSKYEIIPVSSSFNVDITEKNRLWDFLESKSPSAIVHLAAKTSVDACEDDRKEDIKKLSKDKVYDGSSINLENLDPEVWKKSTTAFGVNVVGTKNLADFAAKKDIKMFYVSTDFVFDGEQDEQYDEESLPCPVSWYGQTKFWGEKTINHNSLITRISYPFGFRSKIKRDLIWTLVELLKTRETVSFVSDQIITPTFIDDVVHGLNFLMEKNATGLINLVGNNSLSPYEIGIALCREFNLRESKIELTTREKLYKGRAHRPFKVRLKNDKLRNLGFEMTDFFVSLSKIKKDL